MMYWFERCAYSKRTLKLMTANSRISPNSDLFVKSAARFAYFKLLTLSIRVEKRTNGRYWYCCDRTHKMTGAKTWKKKDAKNVGVNGAAKYDWWWKWPVQHVLKASLGRRICNKNSYMHAHMSLAGAVNSNRSRRQWSEWLERRVLFSVVNSSTW